MENNQPIPSPYTGGPNHNGDPIVTDENDIIKHKRLIVTPQVLDAVCKMLNVTDLIIIAREGKHQCGDPECMHVSAGSMGFTPAHAKHVLRVIGQNMPPV